MPSVCSNKSLRGILGILEMPLVRPKGHGRSNKRFETAQDNDVIINIDEDIIKSVRRIKTQNDDTILVSVKLFISRTQSFGNIGFYLPFDMAIGSQYIKSFHARILLVRGREPQETLYGIFRMLRPDVIVNLLELRENKRFTSKTIDLGDNVNSATFFTKIKNIYLSQGNETRVLELEKQTFFERSNIQVVIQLLSEILTNCRRDGYFPPSPSAGHTHFMMPNTRPLPLYSDGVDTTKTSSIRLLSFVYTASNDIYHKIARAGFYLIGNTGVATCTNCESIPRLEAFKQMESSEFKQMHNFGCFHRKCSSEDQSRYLSRNNPRLDIPDVLDGEFLNSFRRMQAKRSIRPSNLDAPQPQIRISERPCTQYTQVFHADRKPRNSVVTLMKKATACPGVVSSSSCSFDADTFMHDLKWTYVPPPKIQQRPVWSEFALPSKRSDTFRASAIAMGLKRKLVENGFFCQRNLNIQTFCCDIPYIIDVDKDPATVHAQNKLSCSRAMGKRLASDT